MAVVSPKTSNWEDIIFICIYVYCIGNIGLSLVPILSFNVNVYMYMNNHHQSEIGVEMRIL